MTQCTKADVLVLGGGPAGAATALCLLRHSDLNVVVVERSRFDAERVGEQVAPAMFEQMEYLSISQDQLKEAGFVRGYGTSSAWGSERLVSHHSLRSPHGATLQLDRQSFDLMLIEQVARQGALVLPGVRCREISRQRETWVVQARHERYGKHQIRAPFLIDATGRSGHVSRQVGAKVERLDHLMAIGAHVEFDKSRSLTQEALIESTEYGWWYCATLPRERMIVTLFTEASLAARGQFQRPKTWNALLRATRHAGRHARGGKAHGRPWVRNASSHLSDARHVPGFLAVGDAAAAFDPISSTGLGFAMSSGCHAARALIAQVEGEAQLVQSYHASLEENYARFLELRASVYGRERRWSKSPFWAARHRTAPRTGAAPF